MKREKLTRGARDEGEESDLEILSLGLINGTRRTQASGRQRAVITAVEEAGT